MSEQEKFLLRLAQDKYSECKKLHGVVEDETDRAEKENLWAGICTVINQQYL